MTTNLPNDHGTAGASGDAMTFLRRFWLPILALILAIWFIVTNLNTTVFTIGWVDVHAPTWLISVILVFLGFVIGWFMGRRGGKD